ncbi:hypothetical protein I6J77_17315 [Rhodanobacter sp. FDAARGOS 1247]|uniref:hypothetical protein n=1 Tax=Rhodanobacter sp. FDAARGOS 1247 TaxID=2778082 RepID=UPI00194EB9D7|nr:hypothetical protein [Rhodanobacter sp. FDAARGOS 1247]QRP63827.1 hypothetical protein I6J77_17315 [Rhodanobacter sp. FDAARGOS 1247]
MFKVQPLKHVVPFTASVFITSLVVAMYPFHFASLNLPETLKTYLPGVVLCAIFSGFAFWLGLGFSHRVPDARKTFFLVAIFYFVSFMAVKAMAAYIAWYMIFSILVIAFPVILGACWPAAWANNSSKADASGAA